MLAVAKDRHHLTSFKKHPLLRPAARIAFDAEQGCVRRQPPIVKLGLRPGRCSRRQLSTAVPGPSLRQLVATQAFGTRDPARGNRFSALDTRGGDRRCRRQAGPSALMQDDTENIPKRWVAAALLVDLNFCRVCTLFLSEMCRG